MDISELYKRYLQYPTISTDTRKCPKDSIFVALKGTTFNGNQYALKALEQGCRYAIVDEKKYAVNSNIILVDDCLKTLQELANHHRKTFRIPIIGITGTNGKTTTKELMYSVLSKQYNVLATEGNLNNHIGVPLTLLRLNKTHEIAIIEMGASHMGEIKELCEIAEPNFGLITNIGHAHLEGFGSYENIVKTKAELYNYIRNTNDGKLFVDYDNTLLRELSDGITGLYYGLRKDLFIAGRVLTMNPYVEFCWKFMSHKSHVKTRLIGDYNLPNVLAAITVGKYFGVKTELINEAIEAYEPTNNRSQLKKTDKNMLIIDAYNANPTSMLAALDNFTNIDVNNKMLILGDMKELGPDTDIEHQKVVDYVQEHDFEKAFFIGDFFGNTKTSYPKFKDFDELKQYIEENPISNQYILIKGSRGGKLERCIELL